MAKITCQAVMRQSLGSHHAVVRQLHCNFQAVVIQLSVVVSSCQLVVRQSSGSYQAVIKQLTQAIR